MFLQYAVLTKSDYLKEKSCSLFLLAFHSPNCLPFNKLQQCILFILFWFLWVITYEKPHLQYLHWGLINSTMVKQASDQSTELNDFVYWRPVSPHQPSCWELCVYFMCWHLVFCKPESLILQEAMASLDDNLVQAHRCAMMLSAVMWALHYCYWLHDNLIQANFSSPACAAFHISDWRKNR